MSTAKIFQQTYCSSSSKKPNFFKKPDPTKRWVEITLDIKDMRRLLRTANFQESIALSKAITAAERKRDWHYRHEDFDLATASFIISHMERTCSFE